MKKKALALVLSLVMLITICVPGTWATESTESTGEPAPASQQVLTCTKDVHTHDDTCYATAENPVCKLDAVEPHTHEAACYQEEKVLTCKEPEAHVHNDSCFETQRVYPCEAEGHEHDESCTYEDVTVQTCTLPTDGHTHGEECYELQQVTICGLSETGGHVHTADCNKYLNCGQEAHTHGEGCYETVEVQPQPPEETDCTCGTQDGVHTGDCPLNKQDPPADPAPSNHAEGCDGDSCAKEGCTCDCHTPAGDPSAPTCTCGTETGEHVEGCPLYEKPQCTCGTEDGNHAEDCPLYEEAEPDLTEELKALYEAILACETQEDFNALINATDPALIQALAESLTEEELASLIAHLSELFPPENHVTSPFTRPGPFMPAVDIGGGRRMMAAAATPREGEGVYNDGVVSNKQIMPGGPDKDGYYTIKLENYVSGEVKMENVKTPLDVVLVLDQSGSMANNFDGNNSRQAALKNAVTNFITQVAAKYEADNYADHRMSIVTFGSSAQTLVDWTLVDRDGANELRQAISGLPDEPSGGTQSDDGMMQAETLMRNPKYQGPYTRRQRVVIFFTDGMPGDSGFSTSVADGTISSAHTLKHDYFAAVYTVGIFDGANVSQLYGKQSNGANGSKWEDEYGGNLGLTQVYDADIPAANRFMNYVSSNAEHATSLGVTRSFTLELPSKTVYTIDVNYDCNTTMGYYMTAANANDLNNIFNNLSDKIESGGAKIELDATTVVKDIMTPYFELPANPEGKITVKTAECTGFNGETPTWGSEQSSGLSATVSGKEINVSGFNFSENWVGKNADGTTHLGKKLIIYIPFKPSDKFLGGNGVPTNELGSGVYKADGTVVENFDQPTMNVPIPELTVEAPNENVYLYHDMYENDIKRPNVIKIGNNVLDPTVDGFGLDEWTTRYVNIWLTYANESTSTLFGDILNMTNDNDYSVNLWVGPVNDNPNTNLPGTPAVAVEEKAQGHIHVFKPTVTYKDSEVYYGADVPTNAELDANNVLSIKWTHDHVDANPANMIGTEPTLTMTYAPDSSKVEGGKINSKQDIPVAVTTVLLTNNDTPDQAVNVDVTTYVSFEHQECAGKTCDVPEGYEFLLHPQTCELTITKQGGASNEPYVFTILKDGNPYTYASVTGSNSVTIKELPVGQYTVQEDTNWSWRYNASFNPNGVNLEPDADKDSATIYCNNSSNGKIYWLNGFSEVVKNAVDKTPVKDN